MWHLYLYWEDGNVTDYREPTFYDCRDRWSRIQQLRQCQENPRPISQVIALSPTGVKHEI